MRQLLAATVLLALMGLPALYFLRDAPEVRAVTHAVGAGIEGAAGTDATSAIVEGMHRIAAGLTASLAGAERSTGAFSFATIHDEPAGDVSVAIGNVTRRGDATQTGSITLAVGADKDMRTGPADVPNPEQDVAETGPDGRGLPGYRDRGAAAVADPSAPWRTPVSLAAMNGGNTLPRDYPTSFLWFDLV
jgi:hypothetical protein